MMLTPLGSDGDESGEDAYVADQTCTWHYWRTIAKQIQASSGFKSLALVFGGGITLVFTVVFSCDAQLIAKALSADVSGTNVIIVAPSGECNLSPGKTWLALRKGASVNLASSLSTEMDVACWQVGRMAQAVTAMGLQGSLLSADAALHETLPTALLAAAAVQQRAAIVVWNHASAQGLARRPWVRRLLAVQPSNVRWASVGGNVLDDRLAKDLSCRNRPHCGCSDPHDVYVDCLAGVFSLATVALHEQVDALRNTIQRGHLSGIEGLPAAAFANSIAAEVLWSPHDVIHRKNAGDIRMLVDCSRDNRRTKAAELFFAGVQRYHEAHPSGTSISITTVNCRDVQKDSGDASRSLKPIQRLDASKLLGALSSFDVYATVAFDQNDYSVMVPQIQMAGVAVLSGGSMLSEETFEQGVTGFAVGTSSDVQQALESIEGRLVDNALRKQIHASAVQRFSAHQALEQVILGLFPELGPSWHN